ncbi:hypothetical protein GWN63_04850 [Candidatus Bathyarchaeota archaeon]|nr:hypothetical protein [Candidatus Bathyarchaeota archaeon]NIR15070.1 hypothetical protein [Desulfobacterales bacterium]NIU81554.1 hypothetical protein [Candidatus Bathyarchaeota archaeon]NIV68190.1 hypothetical protein [Candidatus Bathyarchaeota archaeon]NIW34467.1 hypothetical protein [Candidatus Bathyarchaeota archaeon]
MAEKYDPSKATLGVHNRVGFDPGHKPPNPGNQAADIPLSDVGKGIGVGVDADSEWELDRSRALKIGSIRDAMDKEATYSTTRSKGEYSPEDVEWPMFPEPGDEEGANRTSSDNTDLEVHGAHEHPKPDPKQLIRERLQNMRSQMFHKAKEEVQEHEEAQERKHEQFKSYPTDIEVNRKKIDIDRSGTITKTGSNLIGLLEEEDANPIKIMLVLDQVWEEDWRQWEPETITQTLEQDGVDVARVNLDKIMALKVLMNTTEFWESPRTFEKVCLAFAGRMVDWGHIQEPRVHDIAACVALVERYIAEHEFSDDVATYVAGCAVRDGYVLLPPVLSFAQFPFSNELAFSMGDDVLDVQNQLMDALEEDGDPPKEHAVQYMRLLRCQYHTQDMVDEARS